MGAYTIRSACPEEDAGSLTTEMLKAVPTGACHRSAVPTKSSIARVACARQQVRRANKVVNGTRGQAIQVHVNRSQHVLSMQSNTHVCGMYSACNRTHMLFLLPHTWVFVAGKW